LVSEIGLLFFLSEEDKTRRHEKTKAAKEAGGLFSHVPSKGDNRPGPSQTQNFAESLSAAGHLEAGRPRSGPFDFGSRGPPLVTEKDSGSEVARLAKSITPYGDASLGEQFQRCFLRKCGNDTVTPMQGAESKNGMNFWFGNPSCTPIWR
jgi:hypothetical protein